MLVVDDDTDLLGSLTLLLHESPRLALAGTATSAHDAIGACKRFHPDVVLADVRMPGLDGLSLTRALTRGDRKRVPKVLVSTGFVLDEYLVGAIGAGACGFIPKTAPWAELEAALVAAHAGSLVLPGELSTHLVELVLSGNAELADLTPRELEVLTMVGAGRDAGQIAKSLFVSEGTVRAHLEHLRVKLGASNRVELALIARRAGLGYSSCDKGVLCCCNGGGGGLEEPWTREPDVFRSKVSAKSHVRRVGKSK